MEGDDQTIFSILQRQQKGKGASISMKAKRILSFLLVLVLCVAMFPATKVSAISTSSVEANLTSWRSNLDGKILELL